MADNYTGDEGTEAVAFGLDVMDGHEDRRDGWRSINKTRDMIVTVRATLRSWVEATFLPKSDAAPPGTVAESKLVRYDGNTRIATSYPTLPAHAANKAYVDNAVSNATPPTFTGGIVPNDIFLPNSTPATAGYVAAYINNDGRISRGASSARYKDDIVDAPDLGDLFAPPLREYEMKGGDGKRLIGYIAEELAEHPDTERFVVYADAGTGDLVPESIDFIAYLLAQNAQLHDRLRKLEE